ncbi:hypothetical protein [Nakamurella deserti]|uniref:hypothetical protein n=1 Tax=Nakamurella deserti TaxID=2164074 RepID=UPI000DBE554B|nr:hypothetical protein [Nakamurella deserti]
MTTSHRLLPAVLGRHRPLRVLAAAMAVCAVVSVVGLVLDDRILTGAPIWAKPLKFSLSIAVYAWSLAWLIDQLPRARRTAWWLGTAVAVLLGVEQVIIVGAVLRGTTSHFNGGSPVDAALYAVMGLAISAVWVITLVLGLMVFRRPGPDRARTLAVRAGVVVALIGMAVAFLMTAPTGAQIEAGGTVVGAHTVGVADGGPGLPLLGWSTVAGDLRIPHFVGMHALQGLPLLVVALELVARRWAPLRSTAVRTRLVGVAAAGWLATTALLTVQALRGQSIVQPDGATLGAAAVVLIGVVAGVRAALRTAQPAKVAAGSPRTPAE